MPQHCRSAFKTKSRQLTQRVGSVAVEQQVVAGKSLAIFKTVLASVI